MAITRVTAYSVLPQVHLMGLAADSKPTTGVNIGERFLETDTGNVFVWTGTAWVASAGDQIEVVGNVASGAVNSGNPVGIGGEGISDFSGGSAGDIGDRIGARFTLDGAQYIAGGLQQSADGLGAGYVLYLNEGGNERPLGVQLAQPGPDGSTDRVKTLGDTAGAGLGVLAAAPWIPGASDIKSQSVVVGATSVNRATVVTPTSGKKIRVVSVKLASNSATNPDKIGVYFGTGAAYLTNPTTVIGEYHTGADGSDGQEWPDGGGPIGAVDAVLSWITETETEVGLDITVQYREE